MAVAWNPASKPSGGTISTDANGNSVLTSTSATSDQTIATAFGLLPRSGKIYIEFLGVKIDQDPANDTGFYVGITDKNSDAPNFNILISNLVAASQFTDGTYQTYAASFDNAGGISYIGSTTASAVNNLSPNKIGFAADFDNGKFYFSINGAWIGYDPANNNGPTIDRTLDYYVLGYANGVAVTLYASSTNTPSGYTYFAGDTRIGASDFAASRAVLAGDTLNVTITVSNTSG